ncbi:hypothetical protein NDN08_000941 [Rhodosorus marinus]|uniref:Cilia- and flagella-associated protein 43 n=1 Tax=Rhodosorus marinus TaxID=101924 RepID=A0AAV8US73_9RHOD|nr:hypothetical protein NDN08_000941 [Rhodosorus marinus]
MEDPPLDQSAAAKTSSAGAKTRSFNSILRIDLTEVIGSETRICCLASCKTPTSWIVIGLESGAPIIVDIETQRVVCAYQAPKGSGEVCSIATANDRMFATGHSTGEVLVWSYVFHASDNRHGDGDKLRAVGFKDDVAQEEFYCDQPIAVVPRIAGRVTAMAFQFEKLAVTSKSGYLSVISVQRDSNHEIDSSNSVGGVSRAVEYGEALCVSWSGPSVVVTGGEDDLVWIHLVSSDPVERRELKGHNCFVTGLFILKGRNESPEFRDMISCGLDGRLILWLQNKSKEILHEEGESFYGLEGRGAAVYTIGVDGSGKWSLNRYVIDPDIWNN